MVNEQIPKWEDTTPVGDASGQKNIVAADSPPAWEDTAPVGGVPSQKDVAAVEPKAVESMDSAGVVDAELSDIDKQATDELLSMPPPTMFNERLPDDLDIGGDIQQAGYRRGETAFTTREEMDSRPVSPDLLDRKQAADTRISPWLVNAPLAIATKQLEETHPDTVAARVSRDMLDTQQKYVTEGVRAMVTSPWGKVLNLITQIIAPDTDFARKSQSTQNAQRAGLFEEKNIPVFSAVADITALGPPALFATKIGPYMLPVLEGIGQATDAAAGVKDAFSLGDIFMSGLMASLIKAKGFLPASVRKQLLDSGGGVVKRVGKALIPSVAMAAEMASVKPVIDSAIAISQGDMEGFKNAWREYPNELVDLTAVFAILHLMPLADAGFAGAIETKLLKFGLTSSQAKTAANIMVYNPQRVDILKKEFSKKHPRDMSDVELNKVFKWFVGEAQAPPYAEVIRYFHTGGRPGLPAYPVTELPSMTTPAGPTAPATAFEIDTAGKQQQPVVLPAETAIPEKTATVKQEALVAPVALARKAVRTSTGKVFEAKVIKKGRNKGKEESFHGAIAARIPSSELTDTMEPGYMGSDGKFYDQTEAEAIPGFLEPVGGALPAAAAEGKRIVEGRIDPARPDLMTDEQAISYKKTIDERHSKLVKEETADIEAFGEDSEQAQSSAKALVDFEIENATWVGAGGAERAKVIRQKSIKAQARTTAAKLPAPPPLRNLSSERNNKMFLKDRLEFLPAVAALPRGQRKLLSTAIDKFDGPIESLEPEELGNIIRTIKLEKPLRDVASLATLTDKKLNSYIAGNLYGGRDRVEKKKLYAADIKELMRLGKIRKQPMKGIGLRSLSQEEKIVLAEYATEHFVERAPIVDTAKETESLTGIVQSIRDAVASINGADIIEHGPGMTEEGGGVLFSFLSERKDINAVDPDGSLRREFISNIEYPLSTDSTDLREELIDYEQQFSQRVAANKWMSNPRGRSKWQKTTHAIRNAADRPLMISKLAVDMGNPHVLGIDTRRRNNTKRGRVISENRFRKEWKDAKVPRTLALHIADKPKLRKAVKYQMGVDPNTHSSKLLAARKAAIAVIEKDPRGEEILKINERLRGLLNGPSAINVRVLKIMEFGQVWDKYQQAYNALNAIPEKSRTPKQKTEFSKIMTRLNERMPWRFNKDAQIGEPVSVEEMAAGWEVFKERNETSMDEWAGKQDFGTRDYYSESTHTLDADSLLSLGKVSERPSESKAELKTKVGATKRIARRTGIPEFSEEGCPYASIERHMSVLEIQRRTYLDSLYVAKFTDDTATRGDITKAIGTEMNNAVKMDLGQITQATHPIAKWVYKFGRAFWTAYSIIPQTIMWFTTRNMGYQGVPYGALAGQYRVVDITKALYLAVPTFNDKSSSAMRHLKANFNETISLGNAVFSEGHINQAPGETPEVPNTVMWYAQNVGSLNMKFSDNFNRRENIFMGDIITEMYLNKFIAGDINKAQLMHGLKMDSIDKGHRRYLVDLFNKGLWQNVDGEWYNVDKAGKPVLNKKNFEKFAWELSEVKNLVANFPYGITERSALEQNANTRPALGILVYGRGTFQVVNETVSIPLARTWQQYQKSGFDYKHFDYKTAATAIDNLFSQLLGRALSSMILGKLIGEKEEYLADVPRGRRKPTKSAYGLRESIFSYGTLGPGPLGAKNLVDQSFKVASALGALDTKTALKEWNKLGEGVAFYVGVIPFFAPLLEATGDRQGIKNMDVIMSAVKWKTTGGRPRRRTTYRALMHFIFNTEPMNRKDPYFDTLKKSYDFIKDSLGTKPNNSKERWLD